ncbi:uncharacterized protein TNCV_3047931 [Trichonephila clavipes]|nr:uncharacterized protein TNCV_3047931 [Trichonephila clavipes]
MRITGDGHRKVKNLRKLSPSNIVIVEIQRKTLNFLRMQISLCRAAFPLRHTWYVPWGQKSQKRLSLLIPLDHALRSLSHRRNSIFSPRHSLALRAKQKPQATVFLSDRLACDQNNPFSSSKTREGCGSPVIKSNHGNHVMSLSPIPLKIRRVGQRCTLNLSRAETSSRWCGVVVRSGGCQLKCRPRHLSMVQNYLVRRQKPSCN